MASTTQTPESEVSAHPKRRRFVWILGVAILIVIAVVSLRSWFRPLGPQLESDMESDLALVLPSTSTPDPEAPKPQCGGPAVMKILVIGNDSPLPGDYTSAFGFADVIRIIRIDFVNPSAAQLIIPRDMWVEIPGLEEVNGISKNRIKTAFAYGNVFSDEFGNGPNLLSRTLAYNYSLFIDHYLVINFQAFEKGVDAIGGIDINVPEPVGDFEAGEQHLTGREALLYVRLRPDNSSDLFRIDRQSQVVNAIRDKVYSPEIFPTLPRLFRSMQDSLVTDLSPSDISLLTCIGQKIDPGSFVTVQFDNGSLTPFTDEFGYESLLPDDEAVLDQILAFEAGDFETP